MPDGALDKRIIGGLMLVTLAGELDLATLPELTEALSPARTASLPDIAIDMRQVTFMDCSTLGVLLATHAKVTAAGGCLRLIGAQREPLLLLTACQLDGVLCVHDSLETAITTVCGKDHRHLQAIPAPDPLPTVSPPVAYASTGGAKDRQDPPG